MGFWPLGKSLTVYRNYQCLHTETYQSVTLWGKNEQFFKAAEIWGHYSDRYRATHVSTVTVSHNATVTMQFWHHYGSLEGEATIPKQNTGVLSEIYFQGEERGQLHTNTKGEEHLRPNKESYPPLSSAWHNIKHTHNACGLGNELRTESASLLAENSRSYFHFTSLLLYKWRPLYL